MNWLFQADLVVGLGEPLYVAASKEYLTKD